MINHKFRRGAEVLPPKSRLSWDLEMFNKLVALAAWGSLAFIAFATLSPIGLRPQIASIGFEHFAAFAVAGFLFGSAYPRHLVLVVVLVLGSAVILEALQLIAPDRHSRLLDLIVKLTGAFGRLRYCTIAPAIEANRVAAGC